MKPLREYLFPQDSGEIHCYRRETDGFHVPYHYHPEIEITLIVRGTGTLGIGDHIRPFGPCTLCMVGENLPHFFESTPSGPGRGSHVAEVIQFPRGVWQSWFEHAAGDFRDLQFLFTRAQRGLRFRVETARSLRSVFRDLRRLQGLPRLSVLLRLLQALVEDGGSPLAGLNFGLEDPEGPEAIHRARTLLLSEYRGPLSHREVASKVHMSPAVFSRQFKRSTGITFQEFLARLRLGEAARLLIESDRRISEICYACGFGNLSNFNRKFKAQRGVTPSEFRAHWRRKKKGPVI